MKLERIHQVVIFALAGLVLFDGSLLLHARLAKRIPEDPASIYRHSAQYGPPAPPDGFASKFEKVGIKRDNQLGWAIRYAAEGCEFCRDDESLWNPLNSRLQKMGYQVIVVVPGARYAYPKDIVEKSGDRQEIFVDVGWIKRFRLTMTPTLLIFDRNGALIWSHVGMLEPRDSRSAIDAIKHAF